MRDRWIGFAVALMLTAAASWAGERVVMEGILVRVNDRIVTVSEFSERVRQELAQLPNPPSTDEEMREFVEMLLNEIVNELVLLERADEKRVTVQDEMLDRAIEGLREENNLLDDEAWEQALASSGITEDILRERYRKTMVLQSAVQGEVRPVEITEEELRLQYEQNKDQYKVPAKVKLEQVFVPDSGDSSGSTEVLMRSRGMVERVREGADLKAEATLAGADFQELGEIPVDDCRPDLRRAIEPLDDGQITDPLTVPGGFQIIRLVARIPAGYQDFDEVVDGIRRQRSAETYQQQTRGMVERLKQEYLVEVNDEYLDVIFAGLGGI
jgi:peptidyl-prolyl cis-trans isomerase SurA